MSNASGAKNKAVEIKLGDDIVKIRYTLNSFIELEDAYGSIDKAMAALQGKIVEDENGKPVMVENPDKTSKIKMIEKRETSFKVIRDVLWAGVIPDKPDITKVEVANMLTLANLSDIMGKVNEAIINALPEKVGEDDVKN